MEAATQDIRFGLRGPRPTSARIVLVTLDDDTFARWGDVPFGLWGDRFAGLITAARQRGATVIGLDVIPTFDADSYLSQFTSTGPFPNAALVEAIEAAGPEHLVLSEIVSQTEEPLRPIFWDELSYPQLYLSLIDLPAAPDGVVRAGILLVENQEGEEIPGFAALLAARASRRSMAQLRDFLPHRYYPETNAKGTTTRLFGVNYTLHDWPMIPAHRLLAGDLDVRERALLKDSLVIIGDTTHGSQDYHDTPARPHVPGISLHADAAATLLDGRALLLFPPVIQSLSGLISGLLVLALLCLLPMRFNLLVVATVAAMYGATAYFSFVRADAMLPLAMPLLAFIGVPLVFFAVRSAEERLRWIQLKAALSPYVSSGICEYLLASEENRKPGGKLTDATCLFLDIRDSTAYGAQHTPDEFIRDLNELFYEIVPAVHNAGGQICKYTGDGLLAVFGAPQPVPPENGNPAEAGVAAALGIARAVYSVNDRRRALGHPPWRIGCGVHSGPFIYGNLGTVERPEFTLIGDTVNVAAKLEALTRNIGDPSAPPAEVTIVISETTYTRHRQPPPVSPRLIEAIRGHGPIAFFVLQLERNSPIMLDSKHLHSLNATRTLPVLLLAALLSCPDSLRAQVASPATGSQAVRRAAEPVGFLSAVRGKVEVVLDKKRTVAKTGSLLPLAGVVTLSQDASAMILLVQTGQRFRATGPAQIRVGSNRIRTLSGTAPKTLPPIPVSLLRPGGLALAYRSAGGTVARGAKFDDDPIKLSEPVGVLQEGVPQMTLRWEYHTPPAENAEIKITLKEKGNGKARLINVLPATNTEVAVPAGVIVPGKIFVWKAEQGGVATETEFRVLSEIERDLLQTAKTAAETMPRATTDDPTPELLLADVYLTYGTVVEYRKALEEALKRSPDDEGIKLMLTGKRPD